MTFAGSKVISGDTSYCLPGRGQALLFRSQNCVFCRLRDSEFHHGLCGNLDLLLRLWIDAGSRFPLLLHQLAKAGQDELAVLLDLSVGEAGESVEEYSGGSFVSGGCGSESGLKFGLSHFKSPVYARESRRFQGTMSLKPQANGTFLMK